MVLKSEQYDDVYFSAQDGLAETRHVFLDGNDLPNRWQGKEHFTIAETGFGTGLNFLAAWKLFEDTAEEGQSLRFISCEKHPLTTDHIGKTLSQWNAEVPLNEFLSLYRHCEEQSDAAIQSRAPKNGLLRSARNDAGYIQMEIHVGDANEILPTLNEEIDAWFLDGFKPSSNPDMWSETVLSEVGRLTRSGGTLATFTAAGFVRRGLQAAGFEIQKRPGFGRKREMVTGVKL